MFTKLICLGVLELVAAAQDIPYEVKYNLTGFTYPRVAQFAHIQGVVKLELIPTETGQEVKVISGHALLSPEAKGNLEKWRTTQPVTVDYIFKLTDPEIVKIRVPKGDAFDRLWLRMFHLTTYTEQPQCRNSSTTGVSKPHIVQQSPMILEVEITAEVRCLQTDTSLVASR